jgi:hypothetical protein
MLLPIMLSVGIALMQNALGVTGEVKRVKPLQTGKVKPLLRRRRRSHHLTTGRPQSRRRRSHRLTTGRAQSRCRRIHQTSKGSHGLGRLLGEDAGHTLRANPLKVGREICRRSSNQQCGRRISSQASYQWHPKRILGRSVGRFCINFRAEGVFPASASTSASGANARSAGVQASARTSVK